MKAQCQKINRRFKPVPCMACGKESDGMVLTCIDPLDQAEPGEQRGGLRVIDGGA